MFWFSVYAGPQEGVARVPSSSRGPRDPFRSGSVACTSEGASGDACTSGRACTSERAFSSGVTCTSEGA